MSAPGPSPTASGWVVVVPVKRLAAAKTRLGGAAAPVGVPGMSGPVRAQLALAFTVDTIAAALACDRIGTVVAVTDDDVVADEAGRLGAVVVPDRPAAGLNAALRYGVRRAARLRPGAPVAALSADLPAARPRELATVLDAARAHRSSFLPDAAGTGTTLLAATDVDVFSPAFGPSSARRHRDSGALELAVEVPSLRRDVDTAADLDAVIALGVGPRTRAVLAVLSTDGPRFASGGPAAPAPG